MRDKVVILGKLDTKFKAPFDDESYDIWAFNKHLDEHLLKRVDKWFDIHIEPENPEAEIKNKDFPFEDLINLVGGKYFNNTVSWLIAYAIFKGYKEILLYGMRFYTDFEWRRGEYYNVRELMFFAKGKGIKIDAPADDVMVKEYELYM